MPGFNIGGGGSHPTQKSNTAEPRRKHRWVVTALSSAGGPVLQPTELVYLQKAARPNFKYDPAEMHHDQEVAYFAGKQSWETMTWSFYDMEDPDISNAMRNWINRITQNFNNVSDLTTVAHPRDYKGQASIQYYGGGGTPSEQWELFGVWPEATNWNELDYTTSDLQLIEVTIRYDKATGRQV